MTERHGRAEEWMESLAPYSRHTFTAERLDRRTALIVVDMQRYFIDPAGDAYLPDGRAAVPRVKALLESFREAGLPVVFTRHEERPGDRDGAMGRWWGSIMEPGDPQLEIVPDLAPRPGEIVIRKHQYSAFHRTGLSALLRERGVRAVVVAGVMTHLCCETTARDAFMEDLDVILAVDAMATSCEELHLAALKTLVNGFAVPALAGRIAAALAGRHEEAPS
jgi:nicotinamidase-related amidase